MRFRPAPHMIKKKVHYGVLSYAQRSSPKLSLVIASSVHCYSRSARANFASRDLGSKHMSLAGKLSCILMLSMLHSVSESRLPGESHISRVQDSYHLTALRVFSPILSISNAEPHPSVSSQVTRTCLVGCLGLAWLGNEIWLQGTSICAACTDR